MVDLGEKSVKARDAKVSGLVLCQGPQQDLCSANTASLHHRQGTRNAFSSADIGQVLLTAPTLFSAASWKTKGSPSRH